MNLPRLIVVCFSLLAAVVQGQNAAEPPKEKAAHRLRLLCVDAVAKAEHLVIAEKTDAGWVARWRVSVASQSLTDPLGFAGRTLGVALDPTPPEKAGGFLGPAVAITTPVVVKPFAELTLPASDNATAILVSQADPKLAPYRVIVLDTATARFDAGKVFVQNFTSHVVAGIFGGKSAKVDSGKSAVVQPGIDQAADMAQVTLARQVNKEWVPFFDTRWPVKVDYRCYLLLLPRADGSIQAFLMPEYPPFR